MDGADLKQAVGAWEAALVEQAARFASAQAISWLETGMASYQNIMFGLALVLFERPVLDLQELGHLIAVVSGEVISGRQ